VIELDRIVVREYMMAILLRQFLLNVYVYLNTTLNLLT
jgi:hypothetical protein